MRYSKWALLLFGAGLVFGLAVVAVPLPRLGRAASAVMAAGILLLPVALAADLRRRFPAPRPARGRARAKSKGTGKGTGKRRAPATRRRAKAKR